MAGVSQKIYTIENYVDFEKVRLKANEKLELYERDYIFSTCGRLCKTKGFDYVVQAAKILKVNATDFVWYWIGDGPDRKAMERIIDENELENEVIITGMQSNPYPYIKACDIYVQPSRAEAYPLSILEALILEKVVITTRTKGGEYILEKHGCGVLVEESPVQIASEIMNLLQNKEDLETQQKKVQAIDWKEEKIRYKREWEELLAGKFTQTTN